MVETTLEVSSGNLLEQVLDIPQPIILLARLDSHRYIEVIFISWHGLIILYPGVNIVAGSSQQELVTFLGL